MAMMIQDVLLVCVGNICRSPMAEALLRDALQAKSGIVVSSAGVGALVDFPAAQHSIDLMAERGLDITAHRARQLTQDMVQDADLILVMEASHKGAIDRIDPTARGKIHRLCEFRNEDIPDPFRQERSAFESSLQMIEQGVQDWAGRILKTE